MFEIFCRIGYLRRGRSRPFTIVRESHLIRKHRKRFSIRGEAEYTLRRIEKDETEVPEEQQKYQNNLLSACCCLYCFCQISCKSPEKKTSTVLRANPFEVCHAKKQCLPVRVRTMIQIEYMGFPCVLPSPGHQGPARVWGQRGL